MGLLTIPAAILIIILVIAVTAIITLLTFAGVINIKPKRRQKALGDQVKERQEAVKRRADSDDGSA